MKDNVKKFLAISFSIEFTKTFIAKHLDIIEKVNYCITSNDVDLHRTLIIQNPSLFYQYHLDKTHLDAVRGLYTRFRPMRQQGELASATQLLSSKANRSLC